MSTTEWIPSDNIAELPVMLAAINFVMEISAFPISAAIIIYFDPEAIEKLEEYPGVVENKRSSSMTACDFFKFVLLQFKVSLILGKV